MLVLLARWFFFWRLGTNATEEGHRKRADDGDFLQNHPKLSQEKKQRAKKEKKN